nr:hypothetical protein [Cellulomonas sp.]
MDRRRDPHPQTGVVVFVPDCFDLHIGEVEHEPVISVDCSNRGDDVSQVPVVELKTECLDVDVRGWPAQLVCGQQHPTLEREALGVRRQ